MNVRHPGPSVGGNTDLQPKLIDLLLAAFAKAVPERVAAATGGSSSNLLFGGVHPETGRYYSNYHFDGMGAGATARKDGNDGEVTRHSNCRNTPVEVFEHRYPLLTLSYGLAKDSGGAGKHRGGLGTERTIRITAPEITFSALFDRCKLTPGRVCSAGWPGGRSALMVKLAGESEFRSFEEVFGVARRPSSPTSCCMQGDELYYRAPGGAGFGDRRASAIRRSSARTCWRAMSARRRPSATTAITTDEPAGMRMRRVDGSSRSGAGTTPTSSIAQVCGRLIPRRSWVFDGGAGELSACSPDCEDLYESYLETHLRSDRANRCGSPRLRPSCCGRPARSMPPSPTAARTA